MAELLLLCFLGPPLIIIGAACAPFIFILGVLAAGVVVTGLAFYVLMRVVLALVLYAYPCPLHSTLWECNREPLAVALTAGGMLLVVAGAIAPNALIEWTQNKDAKKHAPVDTTTKKKRRSRTT